jgi:hypothetical protein
MTPLTPAQLVDCERIALQLAPELFAAPLYVLNVPDGDPALSTRVKAYAADTGLFALQDSLRDAGRWRGHGPVIAFCDVEPHEVLPLLIHELAHCVPFDPVRNIREPTPELRAFQRATVEVWLAGAQVFTPPWQRGDHGLQFVRRCIHLHHRAWQLGIEVGAGDVHFAGEQYGLSEHWRYRRALGDEPRRMACESFAGIESAEPPDEFVQLWRDDLADWYRAHREEFLNSTNTKETPNA